jgi:hypothetical protein
MRRTEADGDPTCPRLTLLFDEIGPTDLNVLRRDLARRRRRQTIELTGWDEDEPPHVTERGIGLLRVRFSEFVVELSEVRAPAPNLDKMIGYTGRPSSALAPLRSHETHVMCWLRNGPPCPMQRLAACLDVAEACMEQGLLGIIQTDAWRCMLVDQLDEFARVLSNPETSELDGYRISTHAVAVPTPHLKHYVTHGNHLWGLPEFVVPVLPETSAGEAQKMIDGLFSAMREKGGGVEPPDTIAAAGMLFQAHPLEALGSYAPHVDSGNPAVVYVNEAARELVGVDVLPDTIALVMARAVAQTFLHVASADGDIEEEELETFLLGARWHFGPDSGFEPVGEILKQRSGELYHDVIQEGFHSGGSQVDRIDDFVTRADLELPPELAQRGKELLYTVGVEVASAAAEGFLGFGARISETEHTALLDVSRALGLEEEEDEEEEEGAAAVS